METTAIPQTKEDEGRRQPRVFPYHVLERPPERLVDRFLEAFAWVLEFTDYKPLLDSY